MTAYCFINHKIERIFHLYESSHKERYSIMAQCRIDENKIAAEIWTSG